MWRISHSNALHFAASSYLGSAASRFHFLIIRSRSFSATPIATYYEFSQRSARVHRRRKDPGFVPKAISIMGSESWYFPSEDVLEQGRKQEQSYLNSAYNLDTPLITPRQHIGSVLLSRDLARDGLEFEPESPPYSPPPAETPPSQGASPADSEVKEPGKSGNEKQNITTDDKLKFKEKPKKLLGDTIIAPSAASGGIPDISPRYLAHASDLNFELPHAQPLLVVIDLNGTLLFRPSRQNPTSFIKRPYAHEFLNYCISVFKVVIWSSAKYTNVEKMVNKLVTPQQRPELVAIWGRDRFRLSKADEARKVMCYKRLSVVWSNRSIQSRHPGADTGMFWHQGNTLLLDDSHEKARSEPFNHIPIPEFKGDRNEVGYVLPQVHDYINKCAFQANVSSYIKETAFGVEPGWKLRSPEETQAMI
ncbi:HAD-like domain-containing protein [Jackrogersella minutella]|nr:HAD-like domain-containing protein [Jackrogersella minutella]